MNSPRHHDILLYGATGYTGRLVARELDRRGFSFALGGRDEEKLDVLARSLTFRPEIFVAEASDETALESAFSQARVVISCAGPFLRFGQTVVGAAISSGAHYVDSTAEQGFIYFAKNNWDEEAAKKKLALCPSFGFDVVPGDMAAHLGVTDLSPNDPAQGVRLFYQFEGTGFSRGTFDSMSRAVTEPGLSFEDGELVPLQAFGHLVRVDFPFQGGVFAVPVPLGETLTVSHHHDLKFVRNFMVLPSGVAEIAVGARGILQELFSGQYREKVQSLINRMPEGPPPQVRRAFQYKILAEVFSRSGKRSRVIVSGRDGYGLTAECLAIYAHGLASGELKGFGFQTPSSLASFDWLNFRLRRCKMGVEKE